MLDSDQFEKYADMSRRYISQAEEEFQKGDLSQASNKAWGAAAMALKGIAERRGWNHNKHGLLYDISGQMADELARPELRIMFRSANAMHQNYYEDWMAADEVLDGIENAKTYLQALEAAMSEPFPPIFEPETSEQAARLRRLTRLG